MPSNHALLSPSAAHRWLHCTAAPKLEALIPDTGSDYAAEGTLAHAMCAWQLKNLLGRNVTDESKEIAEYRQYLTNEMQEYVDVYMVIVMERYAEAQKHTADALLDIEVKLDITDYIPNGFGTSDAVIIADGTMEIIDFKYGKGVKVSAERNPQMMIYALGALARYDAEYRIDKVRMTIVQPRIDNLSVYEMSVDALRMWAEWILKPAADEATQTEGRQCAGDWCRFCKCKASCRELAQYSMSAVEGHENTAMLTTAELAKVLPKLATIKNWLSSVEEYALGKALNGEAIPGFKVVEGRSMRVITSPDAVAASLTALGFADEAIYRPKELRTLTDLEKLIGKKRFAEACGDYVTKGRGKPTIVPESDKRPPYNSALEDFSGILVND